jgi:hypothetical protein
MLVIVLLGLWVVETLPLGGSPLIHEIEEWINSMSTVIRERNIPLAISHQV